MTDARLQTEAWLRGIARDLRIGMLFSTRFPLSHAAPIGGADIARASWGLPVIGALIGLLGALVYWLAFHFALPPLLGPALAVAATLAITGCLHEDGLADTFDGFGGGAGRERKLEIMRDSRIGTYGACALTLSLLLRVGALASLAAPGPVALALIAAQPARACRCSCAGAARAADGLSADTGRPSPATRWRHAGTIAAVGLRAAGRSSRSCCCWWCSGRGGCACDESADRPATTGALERISGMGPLHWRWCGPAGDVDLADWL
jgi:adenosylcobinamide-GDP ribazoletransferase